MVRLSIPPKIAATILFLSDRTCCVCRKSQKPVQIHHIDGNNNINNLAILCLDCHNETLISGGFHRKIDPNQIKLYRDDWLNHVARERSLKRSIDKVDDEQRNLELELATSLAEIYRDSNELELLAMHYDIIGNNELRNRYIEEALKNNPSNQSIIFLRGLQKRSDLIPKNVIKNEIKRLVDNQDWSQLARVYVNIGDYKSAAQNYIKSIAKDLQEGNLFSAAYYLKELVEEGVVEALFEIEHQKSTASGDLWWQLRALEEMGKKKEAKNLLIKNKNKIKNSDDIFLKISLALAEGNQKEYIYLRKLEAKDSHMIKSKTKKS